MTDVKEKKLPSIGISAFVFLSIVVILIFGIMVLKVDIHVLLILGLVVTSMVSFKLGYTMEELMEGMRMSISRAMTAMLIFIMIGAIIGTWIAAGTVPALIYYGLKFL